MACDTVRLEGELKRKQAEDFKRLREMLAKGEAGVRIGPTGAIAFTGWKSNLMFDACAYRALKQANDAGLRAAIVRAEAMSGKKVNERAIAAGVHSHDGGQTWGSH